MCGISGFNFPNEERIRQMNAILAHRGPDDSGFFVDDNISLGHTRLAIIDLSPKGHQPMSYRGRYVIAFNGEIYNYRELKRELQEKGHEFASDSDTEVILAAYAEYGADCISRLNGIFAFAIWDNEEKKLALARDQIGVKPLYYHWDGSRLIFASEIKAIFAHPEVRCEVDWKALNLYLRVLYVPAPRTMFANIRKLEAGTMAVLTREQLEFKRYWEPNDWTDLMDYQAAKEDVRRLTADAVRRQLISDRPVGIFLSGGIDSSIVTGLMCRETASRVKTFSVGYDIAPEKFGVDAALAKKTSEFYGTDHHELIVTGKDALEHFEDVVYHMDEPVSNATEISTYLLSRVTCKEVTVVLGGDGGDELFGGYERYRLSRLISQYQKLPELLRLTARPFLHGNIADKIKLLPDANRYLSFMAQKEREVGGVMANAVYDSNVAEDHFDEYFASTITTPERADFEKRFMWADVKTWLTDESLIRSDKMSMAFGLEQRVPLLDYRLAELSLQIPTKWKIKGRIGKWILRDALHDFIPEHVRHEPKRGWFSPASEWLRRDLLPLAEEALSPNFTDTAQFFNFQTIKSMLTDHIEHRAYHMNLLWALMTFQVWYKKYM